VHAVRTSALDWSTAVFLSVLLHAVLFGFLVFRWEWVEGQRDPEPLVIQATIVDMRAMREQEREREQLRELEIRRQQEAEQKRLDAEREKRRQELAEQKRREQERIAAIQRERQVEEKHLEDLRKQREEAERRRREEQQQMANLEDQRKRDAEDAIRGANEQRVRRAQETAQRVTSLRVQYEAAIQNDVTQNWLKPPSAATGLSCKVLVHQIPGGEVIDASIVSCNGDQQARGSIVQAVLRASPLPYRGFEDVFQRELVFAFRPDE
jgi:colicin import membrane protein